MSGAAFAQSQSSDSLGDVARATRARQQAQEASGGGTNKVITNQDLGAATPDSPDPASSDMTMVSGTKKPDHSADQRLSNRLQTEQRTAELWRSRLQEQENRVADLQARIDRLTAAIHRSVGTAEYDTPVNRYQAIQGERLANLQQSLEQQKRKLATMQDNARRAGMNQ